MLATSCLKLCYKSLAKRLDKREAIIYPFVQYPFLLVVIFCLYINHSGLAFIILFPIIFLINIAIGYLHFRFAKNIGGIASFFISLIMLFLPLFCYIVEKVCHTFSTGMSSFSHFPTAFHMSRLHGRLFSILPGISNPAQT